MFSTLDETVRSSKHGGGTTTPSRRTAPLAASALKSTEKPVAGRTNQARVRTFGWHTRLGKVTTGAAPTLVRSSQKTGAFVGINSNDLSPQNEPHATQFEIV
jgi:hypothetical protein